MWGGGCHSAGHVQATSEPQHLLEQQLAHLGQLVRQPAGASAVGAGPGAVEAGAVEADASEAKLAP